MSAAEATIALWGADGLDWDALAADIAIEASLALELTRQIARLDERIFDLYSEADPDHIVMSGPGVGKILAGQIRGRLGDPHRFTSLAAARSFSGLVPRQNSSGLTDCATACATAGRLDNAALTEHASSTNTPGHTVPRPTANLERCHRTLLEEWAYVRPYNREADRTRAPPAGSAATTITECSPPIGGPPISRVTNLPAGHT